LMRWLKFSKAGVFTWAKYIKHIFHPIILKN
jgi:hypothetical protein